MENSMSVLSSWHSACPYHHAWQLRHLRALIANSSGQQVFLHASQRIAYACIRLVGDVKLKCPSSSASCPASSPFLSPPSAIPSPPFDSSPTPPVSPSKPPFLTSEPSPARERLRTPRACPLEVVLALPLPLPLLGKRVRAGGALARLSLPLSSCSSRPPSKIVFGVLLGGHAKMASKDDKQGVGQTDRQTDRGKAPESVNAKGLLG